MPTDTRPRFNFDNESDASLVILALGKAAEQWEAMASEYGPDETSGEGFMRDTLLAQAAQARKIAGQIEDD